MKSLFLVLVISSFLYGCSKPEPEPPVAEDRLVDLYVQVERLNGRYAASSDSLQILRMKLFEASGLDVEDVERTIDWYGQHPKRGLKFLEKISERLKKEEEKQNTGEAGARVKVKS